MAITGRADVLGVVPTIYAREFMKYTMPNLELWKRINNRVGDGQVGDRVQVGLYNDTSAAPPAATQLHTGVAAGFSGTAELDTSGGAQLTYSDQTIGSTTIELANWYHYAVEVSAYAAATTPQGLTELFRQTGLDSMNTQIDTTVANLISGVSTTRGVLGTALTDDLILDAISDLDGGNIPSNDRHYLFSAQEKANYFKVDKYVNSLTVGRTPITRGELGDLYGLSWAWTTQVPAPAAGQHRNFMFHRDVIGGFMRKEPMARVAEGPDPQFTERIVAMAIWGVEEVRDRFGVQLLGV